MECDICGKEIEETFLGKLKGSIVKINEAGKNKIYHVCSDCQKSTKDLKATLKNK
jgi:hypothetical protein